MRRYVALPRSPVAWSENLTGWVGERPSLDVWEQDKTPQPIGLLDAHGTPIYVMPDTIRMGFPR